MSPIPYNLLPEQAIVMDAVFRSFNGDALLKTILGGDNRVVPGVIRAPANLPLPRLHLEVRTVVEEAGTASYQILARAQARNLSDGVVADRNTLRQISFSVLRLGVGHGKFSHSGYRFFDSWLSSQGGAMPDPDSPDQGFQMTVIAGRCRGV